MPDEDEYLDDADFYDGEDERVVPSVWPRGWEEAGLLPSPPQPPAPRLLTAEEFCRSVGLPWPPLPAPSSDGR